MNFNEEVPDLLGELGDLLPADARKYNSVPKLMVYNTALFSAQVVGSGGVPIEEFLRWDIGNLLE